MGNVIVVILCIFTSMMLFNALLSAIYVVLGITSKKKTKFYSKLSLLHLTVKWIMAVIVAIIMIVHKEV